MDWHITDARNFRVIDREVGEHSFSPAQYEIVRRMIYASADFDYKILAQFSDQAVQLGAAALAARTTIVVDVPMVQVGIMPVIQSTFSNPVYCSLEAITRPQREKPQVAWGIETLAQRYPEGIFVIGQAQPAFLAIVDLIESGQINPALIVTTPAGFVGLEKADKRLANTATPSIRVRGRKGGAGIAAAIINGLATLAWLAYSGEETRIG